MVGRVWPRQGHRGRPLNWVVSPMPSEKHLDILIGEALECANEAAAQVRALHLEPLSRYLKSIGHAVNSLWELRETLYKEHPELKRDFVSEYELDEARYNSLSAIHDAACQAERSGNLPEAARLFEELRADATYGFFKLCAEAGLYRTLNGGKG